MIDDHVVELTLECLDQGMVHGSTVTLVQVHWYIDARNRITPSADEINAALSRRPQIAFSRNNGSVVFSTEATERSVTSKDMDQAYAKYRKEFALTCARPRK
jgi:hypothetical protein